MADELQNVGPTFGTVSRIIDLLEPLNADDRQHVLRTVATWFRVGLPPARTSAPVIFQAGTGTSEAPTVVDEDKFSDRSVLSVKDFIFEKDPKTEVERLACLAYYLTHYMESPYFKNIDLSRLNTEAAQRKLSNPAVAANNAIRDGFFVAAPKQGYKQLSAMGERFVHALPDREAALKIKQRMASRRGRRPAGQGDSEEKENGSQEAEALNHG